MVQFFEQLHTKTQCIMVYVQVENKNVTPRPGLIPRAGLTYSQQSRTDYKAYGFVLLGIYYSIADELL